ncbi:hypothetical protein IP88_14040 [alpha proteobacterium AAP81b]|nr:hypothetical protein IP88_14040 [alpha proteobacterium AAP81b]
MLKTLHGRSLALLVAVVLIGQMLALVLAGVLVVRPQIERVAAIMANNLAAITVTMAALPPAERTVLIGRINATGALRILPGDIDPPEDRDLSSLLEVAFLRAFARAMASDQVVIRYSGGNGQVWVRAPMGGAFYWISYDRPDGVSPAGALLASVATAVLLALGMGFLLQRRIGVPLRRLADAADAVRGDSVPAPLATDGPLEIAAVAGSFNRMAQRLHDFEANRALLLAGISHDLRTPLAKIRLALALGRGVEPEVATLVDTQFDKLDAMLGQFLDFGRWMDGEPVEQRDIVAEVRAAVAEIDPDLAATIAAPPLVMAVRPMALRRGIVNMLGNARRHGAPPIDVTIAVDAAAVAISIDDRGPGVAEALLPGLAVPFVHGGASGSTGLGLAIVRHVAIAHGGRLVLANRDGGGFRQQLVLRRD